METLRNICRGELKELIAGSPIPQRRMIVRRELKFHFFKKVNSGMIGHRQYDALVEGIR